MNGIIILNPYELECVRKAIVHLEKHYQDTISADQLSLEVCMDIKKLQAGFKKLTHLTVHNYLIKVRLCKAKEDLFNFSLSIKMIADRHGFSSSSHFGDLFRKDNGVSPKEYRRQMMLSEYVMANEQ